MPPLTDKNIIAAIRVAFEEASSGGVFWKQLAAEWVRKNLEGCGEREITDLLLEYIQNGGRIDRVVETREEYRDLYAYHYDFRILVCNGRLYVETVLDETKMGPTVTIVNIHAA